LQKNLLKKTSHYSYPKIGGEPLTLSGIGCDLKYGERVPSRSLVQNSYKKPIQKIIIVIQDICPKEILNWKKKVILLLC